MIFYIDEKLPLGRELFGRLGDVRAMPGRDINPETPGLDEADALVIRTDTKVTAGLLEAAPRLRMIGTASVGTDHVNFDALREARGPDGEPVELFSAAGANARSVADYIWLALCRITADAGEPLARRSMGIIGCGNCGSEVARTAESFGMRVLRRDPPRAEAEDDFPGAALEETLSADYVTLHVPLTTPDESDYPTRNLLDADRLAGMRPGGWLFNACRGAVVNSPALADALEDGPLEGAVLDVYEDEPTPLKRLVRRTELATPHIAGYAIEGRRRATTMVYHAVCEHLGAEPVDTEPMLTGEFSPPEGREVTFRATGEPRLDADNALRALLRETYDIERVSRTLKNTLEEPDRGEAFDRLRNLEGSGRRHELRSFGAAVHPDAAPQLRREIRGRLYGLRMPLDADPPNYVVRPVQ